VTKETGAEEFATALRENRVGLVPMTRDIMRELPDLCAEIQARMLIWDLQARFYADRIDVIAYSPDFESQEQGVVMPTYEIIVTEEYGEPELGELPELLYRNWRFKKAGYEDAAVVEGAPV